MPPKKTEKGGGGGKKPSATKLAEDRTFGMKNKKGAVAQKQIAQMAANLKAGGTAEEKKKAAEKAAREREKKAAEDARREAAALMNRPAQIQKVPFGVDPKTVVCIFYKKGDCEKGKKCKFSHDLSIERKTEKKNLYSDTRKEEEEEKKKQETSAEWDEEQLRKVVLSKKGNQQTTTEKVCKFFISAIEDGKYGWFWICPNGGDKCMYKHALPPGFVLKTKEQRAAEKALMDKSPLKTLTLEDFLESERHKLTGTLTPVTPETFAKWKKDRLDKKAAEEQARAAKENTGRAMFESGKWRDEEDSDSDDDDSWNLEKLRQETEAIRNKKEEDRLLSSYQAEASGSATPAEASAPTPEAEAVGV
ncbi:Translation machinery-associated protein 46 [Purpureocillium takamizusanense]|uniref:Translation machinery-associated protein 46 n=1 Tax=Purpureocillium takamizusanense TaxID=2060973 RepID=A0A9Q8QFG8_9HYPO|nr:Translation machinery-associated protein 46 [Purpureocillium takamizusanense]UNI19854.1 Translation machinery-associated protein 46 [Purpureocillium takamizusanense]